MNIVFENEEKLKFFEQIQLNLCSLECNASDTQINQLIKQIPESMLVQKDDLMVICHIFAVYIRIKLKSMKKNAFKLFGGIMDYLKKYLQNESIFFWNILGGLHFLKLWMYQEGLISIETIILAAKKNKSNSITKYFLPEIIEREPDVFENELRYTLDSSIYSPEKIKEHKEKRDKYLKWICDSGDYNDPLYHEIETRKLFASIMADDIDSFQKLISNNNIDINTKIRESIYQNSHLFYVDSSLLDIAIEYNATKIAKFLILNNAEFTNGMIFGAITSNNYEMIHLVESNMPDKSKIPENLIWYSVNHWNDDVTEYALNNYNELDLLEKSGVKIENKKIVFDTIQSTFEYVNFSFFRTKLLPFLRNNEQFVSENIHDILRLTFCEKSGYFTKEFLKYPNIDINHYFDNSQFSILGNAINENNTRAVEILMENRQIDVNKNAFKKFPPLIFAIGSYVDMKIVDLLCRHPEININLRDGRWGVSSFEISVSRGNFYSFKYLTENYEKLEAKSYGCLFFFALKLRFLQTLRLLMQFYFKKGENDSYDVIEKSVKNFKFDASYRDEYLDDLKNVYNELKNIK